MRLTNEQIAEFRREGVLIAGRVLTDKDLQPVIKDISAWIDRRARTLKAEGALHDLCEDEPFERRLVHLSTQCPTISDGMDIMHMRCPALYTFLHNGHLLDAVESLIGPEITCNPIQHLRAKIPKATVSKMNQGLGKNVPWHQDAAVTWEEADPVEIITCWIPLVNATAATGCMQVLPGVFRQAYLQHQAQGATQIMPQLMPDVPPRVAACAKGSIVFMNKYTPHRSTDNVSDVIRWSLDLRYQPTGRPTGRPFHPAFVVRSQSNPDSAHLHFEDWCHQWEMALKKAKGYKAHRTVPPAQRGPTSA